jgi:H+-transporting ATPase
MAASDKAAQDLLDMVIFNEAQSRSHPFSERTTLSFTPFDPATKRTEARIVGPEGRRIRIVKGSPLILPSLGLPEIDLGTTGAVGQRTTAVLSGPKDGTLSLLGRITFSDPLRSDSMDTVRTLHSLGIRVRLVTGDTGEAAIAVARSFVIQGSLCPGKPESLNGPIEDCGLFSGVLPRTSSGSCGFFRVREELSG